MVLLQAGEGVLILLDGRFELFDIFGASLSEGGLSLSIALLALLGRGIDLTASPCQSTVHARQMFRHGLRCTHRLPPTFALLRLGWLVWSGIVRGIRRGRRLDRAWRAFMHPGGNVDLAGRGHDVVVVGGVGSDHVMTHLQVPGQQRRCPNAVRASNKAELEGQPIRPSWRLIS